MNKKGMTMEALVKLLLALPLIIIFSWLLLKIIAPGNSQTQNSFKTLGAETKLLIEDLENEDKVEIVIPMFVDSEWAISAVNKDALLYPAKCKGVSCIMLFKKTDTGKIYDVVKFDDVEFEAAAEYIQTSESRIISVKIVAEKKNKKIMISMQKVSSN